MSEVVLDSAAVLVLLLEEPGADAVRAALGEGAFLSSVNLAEVVSRLQDLGSDDERIHQLVDPLKLDVLDHNEALAWTAGLLRASTRRFGLSLGDRACLALALSLGRPALTADRNWAGVDVGVEVVLCR